MSKDEFETILIDQVNDVLQIIQERKGMNALDARLYFYSSALYSLLEREETKVWYYSGPQLYELLEEEKETGEIQW